MKKLVMTAAMLACAASVVTAQTVTSANIVGYTKISAVGGELTLVALNFEPATNLVTELIGEQLPFQSKLYVWDKASAGYRPYTKAGRSSPGAWPATAYIDNGEAFFIEAGGVAGETNEVILAGEVLLSETNSVVLASATEYDATGFYYPVDIPFGNTALADALPWQSTLYLWNGGGYTPYTKAGRSAPGVWSAAAQAEVLPAAGGFWIQSGDANPVVWDEPRPFTP
jgi:hypothetical protein